MAVNYTKTTGSNLRGLWMKLLAQVARCPPCCWLRSGSTNWKRFLVAWRWISWGDGEATGGMIWPSKMVDFSDFPTKRCENHEHVGKSPSKFGRSIKFSGIRHDMIYSTKNGYTGTGQATRRGQARFHQLVNFSGELIGSLGSINSNLLQGVTKGRPCTFPTWTWRCHGWSSHFLEAKCWFHLSCCWWLTTIHSWVLNPLDIFQYWLLDLTYLLRRWRFL